MFVVGMKFLACATIQCWLLSPSSQVIFIQGYRHRCHNSINGYAICLHVSQHVPEASTVIVLRHSDLPLGLIHLNSRPILLIEFLILPNEQEPQSQCQEGSENHKSRTNRHPLNKARCLTIGKDIGTQKGATLTDNIKQNNTSTTTSIRTLVICRGKKAK